MKVSILDYNVGNTHSLMSAFSKLGHDSVVVKSVDDIENDSAIVLPGVGAFTAATEHMAPYRDELLAKMASGQPVIGICLGMQVLFDCSEEGRGQGLSVLAGSVTTIQAQILPQIGWNTIDPASVFPIPAYGYYANSFACRPDDESIIKAWTVYGEDKFPAIVNSGNIWGFQFHPEKSSDPGLALLARVLETFG